MELYFAGDAVWQVRDAWERAKPYNPGMLWIAVEDQAEVPSQVRFAKLWGAILACQELGATPGIYTAKWAWMGLMGNTQAFAEFPLWVAAYDGVAELDWGNSAWYGPFGGWAAPTIKQFGNSQTWQGVWCDVNVRLLVA